MAKSDQGWNDPPLFSYSDAKTDRPRRTLNKRVAFPISSTDAQGKLQNVLDPTSPFGNAIPLTFVPMPCPRSNQPEPEAPPVDEVDNIPDEEKLSFIVSALDEITSKIPASKQNDMVAIRRRLRYFRIMWNKNLSADVKKKMYKLVKELESGNYDEADTLHCSMIVDHVSEVSHWMVAIKHIIHFFKNPCISPPSSPSSSTPEEEEEEGEDSE